MTDENKTKHTPVFEMDAQPSEADAVDLTKTPTSKEEVVQDEFGLVEPTNTVPMPKVPPVKDQPVVDPDVIAQIKQQIMEELKDEHTRKLEESKHERDKQRQAHAEYVEKMKASPEPWVDVVGWIETDQGVKVELDWNDAFVDHLKVAGVNGADEDQVVQRWITLLLHDMATEMEEETPGSSDFE